MINFPANQPPAEAYENPFTSPPGHTVLRWWLPDFPRIMVGGNVVSQADWEHLANDFGITHCLDVEAGRPNDGRVPPSRYLKVEMVDNGMPMAAELLRQACSFARDVLSQEETRLYLHCHLGGSRSPAYAYAILRCVYGLSHEDGIVAVNKGFPHGAGYEWSHTPASHAYIGAIDCWMDRGGLGA